MFDGEPVDDLLILSGQALYSMVRAWTSSVWTSNHSSAVWHFRDTGGPIQVGKEQ